MINSRPYGRLGAASALSILLAASIAGAQPETKAVAVDRVRFKAAQQLYDKGDFAGALKLFQDVLTLNPSPNARLYEARCLQSLGRLPEAYEEFTIAARDADALAAKEPRYIPTRDAAGAERAALASKIALLSIAFTEQPPELVVKVGDRTIEPSRRSDPIAVKPGAVTVEASAPSVEPYRKELTINAGASETLAVVLVPRGPAAKPPPPTPEAASSGGALRMAGFGVLGLGVLGGATFAIAGVMANNKYSAVSETCGGVRCTDPKTDDEIDAGATLDTVANIGLVVGVAGVLGGAAMIFFGGPKEMPVSAGATAEGGWITYRSRF